VASDDRLRELEEKYEDYRVYDNQGERIGKVDDLFVDETDREEYIGVKMGFLGLKSTLIPMDIVRVNEGDRTIEVSESKDHVRNAPSFDDDEDITPDYEDRIRSHFGLESLGTLESGYGAYSRTGGDHEDREREGARAYETEDDSTDYNRSSADPEHGKRADLAESGEDSRDATGYGGARESSEGGSFTGSTGDLPGRGTNEDPPPRDTRGDHRRRRRPQLKRHASQTAVSGFLSHPRARVAICLQAGGFLMIPRPRTPKPGGPSPRSSRRGAIRAGSGSTHRWDQSPPGGRGPVDATPGRRKRRPPRKRAGPPAMTPAPARAATAPPRPF
jgi:sporulation protein YlmC with PRC-barrel domain